jgi:hypothetical protein
MRSSSRPVEWARNLSIILALSLSACTVSAARAVPSEDHSTDAIEHHRVLPGNGAASEDHSTDASEHHRITVGPP